MNRSMLMQGLAYALIARTDLNAFYVERGNSQQKELAEQAS